MNWKHGLVTGLAILVSAVGLAGCGDQGKQIAQDQQRTQQQQPQQNNQQSTNQQTGPQTNGWGQSPYPNDALAKSVLTAPVKAQLGSQSITYNGLGAFTINGGKSLNTNVNSAPYVQLPKRNPAHGNRLEGTARAWLNHSSRQYQSRQQTGNGRGSFKPVGFVQRMGLDAKKTGYNHLYDRGHLIAYAIAGRVRHFNPSESNVNNIVTQTAWSNEAGTSDVGTGQNYYEGLVRKALDENKQVMYAVTPIYANDTDLVPVGMHLQAATKQQELFNVFVPNVQVGVTINYANGQSQLVSMANNG